MSRPKSSPKVMLYETFGPVTPGVSGTIHGVSGGFYLENGVEVCRVEDVEEVALNVHISQTREYEFNTNCRGSPVAMGFDDCGRLWMSDHYPYTEN